MVFGLILLTYCCSRTADNCYWLVRKREFSQQRYEQDFYVEYCNNYHVNFKMIKVINARSTSSNIM